MFLLGRRDQPTDGVRDYSLLLAGALEARGHRALVVEADWSRQGWPGALAQAWRAASPGPDRWVLLQYTHLAWARRGFPLMALLVAGLIRTRTARLCVVVHDPVAFPGERLRDRLRRGSQVLVMRGLDALARATVVTIPASAVSWLTQRGRGRVAEIPVGPNIQPGRSPARRAVGQPFTVAVFGVTGGVERELDDIAAAVDGVSEAIGEVRLLVLGRGSEAAEAGLRGRLRNPGASLCVSGVVAADQISAALAQADACLFVRGALSNRRGSAVAAIAHGLPVIGYRGAESAPPLTEAGVVLVPTHDTEALTKALVRLVNDPDWRQELQKRGRVAYEGHFGWDRIAQRFEALLLSNA